MYAQIKILLIECFLLLPPSPIISFLTRQETVSRRLAIWVSQGLRPLSQLCGILMWAICNDKPPISAKEWQFERLWQYLIAVRKSSWRMCQLNPSPLPACSDNFCSLLRFSTSFVTLCFLVHVFFVLGGIQELILATINPTLFALVFFLSPCFVHSFSVDSCCSIGAKTQKFFLKCAQWQSVNFVVFCFKQKWFVNVCYIRWETVTYLQALCRYVGGGHQHFKL